MVGPRRCFIHLKEVTSSRSIAYLRKWFPAAILIGVAAGAASMAFWIALNWTTELFLGLGAGFVPPLPAGEGATLVTGVGRRWMIPVVTTLGGLLSGVIAYKLAPQAAGDGVDAAVESFHYGRGLIHPRTPLIKIIASAITIGSGGSAGREGPIALIGAGCGSLVGRLLGLGGRDLRLALVAGLGAGLGSIFKAPFGGALLSVEILYLDGFEVEALIPSFVATIVAYSIFASWLGFAPMFGEHVAVAFHNPKILSSYAMLGILCGVVGILYAITFHNVRNFFGKSKIPERYRAAIGGLLTGLIGLALPQVLGTGYGWLQLAMQPGTLSLVVLVALVFAKIVATSCSVGSGGSGGVFAPGLVIGGMLAASLWTAGQHTVISSLLPNDPYPFVLVGMMALFGAISHAPVAVIIMVTEMSGTYTILAPAMIAVGLAYVIVGRNTIYQSQVSSPSASPAHRYEYASPLLRVMKVRDAMIIDCPTLFPRSSLEMAAKLVTECRTDVPVVNEAGELIGIIAKEDILPVPNEQRSMMEVGNVMTTDLIVTNPEETLERALELMVSRGIAALPVVERRDSRRLLGLVTRNSIIQAYESEVRKLMQEG